MTNGVSPFTSCLSHVFPMLNLRVRNVRAEPIWKKRDAKRKDRV